MSTQYITPIGLIYNVWDFTWRVSDCEELVVEFKEKSNHFFLHHLQK